jgi:hypothetical protein
MDTNNININININHKRSISYTTEEIAEKMKQAEKHRDLLFYYLDHIRSYSVLSNEMMEIISNFDENSKMIIICEYNKIIQTINCLCE